jgi:murein DD-endopeptidase
VVVKEGDRVKSGQVIARLGSSGSSSMGPHLHFHVSDTKAPLAAEGQPFVFASFTHLGAFASIDAMDGGQKWIAAAAGLTGARRDERPSPMSVVQFP